jgi:hypothetical protein
MGAAFSPGPWLLRLGFLGAGLCGCIVSVAGLTGGAADAGPPDSSTDTGAMDAVVDQGPMTDGGAEAGNCGVPYSPPDGAPVACPPASDDAGPEGGVTCSPVSLPSFQEHFVPPNPPSSVCTTAQIAMVVTCLTSNSPDCTAFVSPDAGNKTCIECMVSPPSAASYGPIIIDSTDNVDTLNVGGCIALVDPCQMPCAYAATAVQQCHFAACASCPLSTAAGLQAFNACSDVADTCSCLPESTANQACVSRMKTSETANCYPAQGFATAAAFYGKVFCGGGP